LNLQAMLTGETLKGWNKDRESKQTQANISRHSGVGGGGAGVQAHPQKFWFVENPAPNVLQKNTWRPFFGGHTKKGLDDLCGRKFVGKIAQKLFGQVWEIQAKILRIPKNLPAPTPASQQQLRQLKLEITSFSNNRVYWNFKTYFRCNLNVINRNTSCDN